jgi:transposase InsO family protein
VLQIAPSGYWIHAARQRNPQLRCARAQRDDTLVAHIERVWQTNMQVYGADKVWKQMNREGVTIARCTVERLMKRLGLQGVRRGKVVRTTTRDAKLPCPLDRVNRVFQADRPNQLWVSDFTYVSTWQGWLYVAFVIDVYARRIVGWRVSSSMHTEFVLDALEQALYARQPERDGELKQALYARQPERDGELIHHSGRGSQYVSIRYSERLAEAGIEPSVGSKGDSYDNALAETINGLYKAEVIHRRSWPTRESVELATLEWVSWFNHHRLLGPIGYIPPAEAEANYYRQLASQTSLVEA